MTLRLVEAAHPVEQGVLVDDELLHLDEHQLVELERVSVALA